MNTTFAPQTLAASKAARKNTFKLISDRMVMIGLYVLTVTALAAATAYNLAL